MEKFKTMNAEKFITEKRDWNNGQHGSFDFNGIVDLLQDFQNELSKDFESSARMLIKHICENHHPHVTVIVTPTGAELLEGVKSTGLVDDYLTD
ncbi:MAG: hypothetical protein WC380_00040 [Pedobacter sp.]|jgi:hypothetical protein